MGALKRTGLTLVETIIAIFILIAGFLVMGAMFHVALRHTARLEARQLAVVLAEKKLEEIKGWSAATHGSSSVPFSDWSSLASSVTSTDPDYPGYTVTMTPLDPSVGVPVLLSPCSEFEQAIVDPALRRTFTTASVRAVRLEVAWSGETHELVSLVGMPPARPGRVEIGPGAPLTIGQNANQTFTAQGFDANNRPIPDLKFRWFVRGGGNGTLTEARDGKTVTLLHRIQVGTVVGYGSGDCQLVAVALIGGRRVEGVSGGVTLP